MAENIVKKDPKLFEYIPAEFHTDEMYAICKKLGNGTNDLIGATMTGKQFNQLFGTTKFYKFTYQKEVHYGFKFFTGLNVDTIPFRTDCNCCAGGFYFTAHDSMKYWMDGKTYKRSVTVPDDAMVHFEKDKLKADKIILGPKEPIISFFSYLLGKY